MKPDPLHAAALALGATARPGDDPDATFAALRPAAIDRALRDPTFRALGPAAWTTAYERLIAHRPHITPHGLALEPSRAARKQRGSWYTPAPIVDALLTHALAPLLAAGHPPLTLRICDPACGAGPFLLAAARHLLAALPHHDPHEARRLIVAHCLHGADLDPGATALTRRILEDYADAPIPQLDHHLITGDALLGPAPGCPLPANLPPLHPEPIDWPRHIPPDGYHAVIGNPPYRAGRHAALAPHAPRIRALIPTAEYQLDPYLLFLDRAARLTRPDGRLALLVPRTWMSNHRAARLRRWLLTTHRLEALIEVPPDAFDAIVATAIAPFTAHRGPTPATVPVTALDATPRGHLTIPPDGAPIPHPRDPRAAAILHAATHWTTTLGDIADITRGINPYHHTTHTPAQIRTRAHHADHPRPGYTPELRGRNLPAPYRLTEPGRYIHYGPWLKEPRHPRYFEGPRLIVRKILGQTLHAAAIDHPIHCDQSLYIARLPQDTPYPLPALAACIQSRLIATLIRTRHQAHDRHFPQLKVDDLRALPLPPVPPDDPRWQTLATHAAALQATHGHDTTLRDAIEALVDDLYLINPAPFPKLAAQRTSAR